jgi:hypothetical protein
MIYTYKRYLFEILKYLTKNFDYPYIFNYLLESKKINIGLEEKMIFYLVLLS